MLIPQPAPRQFDPEGARRSVSSFADTLASFDITTGIRAGRQAKVRRQVSPVLELSPEHLCGQEHRTVSSNTAKPFEQHGLLVFRKPLRFSRKGFVAFFRQSLDHLVRQFQAFERAHDLAHELIGERAAIGSFEAIQFLAPCDHRWIDMPDA